MGYGPEDPIGNTLAERGDRYGNYTGQAAIASNTIALWRGTNRMKMDGTGEPAWPRLTPVQQRALEAIADKIARILNGDPNYADNWHDIAGYARLAEERCAPPVQP